MIHPATRRTMRLLRIPVNAVDFGKRFALFPIFPETHRFGKFYIIFNNKTRLKLEI